MGKKIISISLDKELMEGIKNYMKDRKIYYLSLSSIIRGIVARFLKERGY